MREHLHEPDAEGLSYVQRQELAHQKELELSEKESHAQAIFDLESLGVPCTCEPDCPEDNCKLNIPRKKAAQQKYDKTMAELHPERKSAAPKPTLSKSIAAKPPHKKPLQTKGPSTLTSKSAASLLSQPKPSTTVSKPRPQSTTTAKARLPFSNISSRKQTPPPTNPSPMRHTAATLASKTTIGRSAGRATSANYRKTAAPNASTKPPITALPPSFERDYEDDLGFEARPLEELLREGAEEDFVLEL